MPKERHMREVGSFFLVDVFGTEPLSGNPLAVVFGAAELTTEQMQNITRWLNYSETTFVLPATNPAADYRVRIFTLEREMPFAGHPTLGSCHAWLAAGGNPRREAEIIQECGVGLVTVRKSDQRLEFAAPPLLRSGAVDEEKVEEFCSFLCINRGEVVDAAWADNGPGWVALLLRSSASVLSLSPKRSHPTRLDVGVVGPYPTGSPAAFELRAFFTDHQGTVREDPVTGSLNASVAQWLFSTGRAVGHYAATQGTALGRRGRIHLTQDASGQVWVGGKTATMFSGQFGESLRPS
jgi:PhzF family phenazine biosynthesis protein